MLALEIEQQLLHPLPLEAEVAADRTAAADDRQPALGGVGGDVGLGDVGERADDDVAAVVRHQPGRHRLESAGEEQVQEQRLGEVVGVVAKRDLGRPHRVRHPVENPAAQARAQRARRRGRIELVVDHLADRGVLDAALPAAIGAGLGDHVVLVALVAGVDVDGDQGEVDRRAQAQLVEDLQQGPAVLAAREADHDAVAVLDEEVIGDRPRRFLRDTRFQLGSIRHSRSVCLSRRGARAGPGRRGSARPSSPPPG
jgi:hypothetical protein